MGSIKVKDADGTTQYYEVTGAGDSTNPFQPVIPDYRLQHAVKNIFDNYGDTVDIWEKGKPLIKFGKNDNLSVGITHTVWLEGGNENYLSANEIDRVVSTNAGDTQTITIEGHTISGSDFTFVTQNLTLNGTTDVNLTTNLARASRMYNTDSTDFAGTITVFKNGADNYLNSGTGNQSEKCATTMSSQDYWIITGVMGCVNRNNTAKVDFELQIRESGGVFRTRYEFTGADDSGVEFVNLDPYIIAPKNSDIRVVATASASSTQVTAAIHGYLAIVT